jgi:hypothetical protein
VKLCLPWTKAEYEQIVGRIRRQGSVFEEVEVVVPQVALDYEGDTWSSGSGAAELLWPASARGLWGHLPCSKPAGRRSGRLVDRFKSWLERPFYAFPIRGGDL